MNKILVDLKNDSYPIYFLDTTDKMSQIDSVFEKYNKILIVTDDVVSNLYLKVFESYLLQKKHNVQHFVFKHGESSKNIEVAMSAIDYLAKNDFHRNDLIIALGGGVVGDLAGFVSSIYMRGIDFIQIPTTLLAAVDASIGGKTAIDIKYGKNLVGTFHQPVAVIEIYSILKDLPDKLMIEGSSEIIKYGVIYDSTILDDYLSNFEENLKNIIFKSALAKADVVSKDEKENGLRKILNFGHTLAHSIEECSKHQISHGTAVAYGMVFSLFVSYKENICSLGYYKYVRNVILSRHSLSLLMYKVDDLIFYMRKDKKNTNANITFVLSDGKNNFIRLFKEEKIREYLDLFINNEQNY